VHNVDFDDFIVTNPVESSCQVPVILGYRKQITIIGSNKLLNDKVKVVFLSYLPHLISIVANPLIFRF
jgi:hypothetical protein